MSSAWIWKNKREKIRKTFGVCGFFCIFATEEALKGMADLANEHKLPPFDAYSFIVRVMEYKNRLCLHCPLPMTTSVSATFK